MRLLCSFARRSCLLLLKEERTGHIDLARRQMMSSSENDYSYGHNSSDEDGDSNSSGTQDVAVPEL